jgi:hypothetical protein
MDRPDRCLKCGKLCAERNEWLRGPLYGKYEWLCADCAVAEEAVYPLVWKKSLDPR